MSYAATKWAKARDLSDAKGKGVLVALANYADHDGVCFPSVRTLAEDVGKSSRTVRVHLNRLREGGYILSRPVLRPNASQSSNEYLLVMGQSVLLPWLQRAKSSGVGEDSSGVGEESSPLEPLGNLYGIEASLPCDEKLEKLELLTKTFGKYACILGEVEGRREKWLELPLAAIKKAIADVTGHEHFITDLKLELDKLAHVSAPQSAKRSAPRRRDAPAPPGTASRSGDARLERYVPVPGERNPAENARRWEERRDQARRETEESEQAARQRLWAQAQELEASGSAPRATGGHFPRGLSPPPILEGQSEDYHGI